MSRTQRRPLLVTVLAGAWMLLAVLGAIGAVLAFSRSSSTAEQRVFASLSLLLAALFGACAFGLLRRAGGARALLATAAVFALVVSGFSTYRAVTAAGAPAASLAATEPDAANALALFRAGSAVAFLVSSIPLIVLLGLLRHPSVGLWLGIPARTRKGPDAYLLVGAASLTGPNADQFIASVDNNGGTCQTLAAGQTCIVRVQFAPTSVGAKSAALSLASDAGGPVPTADLTGTGI